MSRGFWRLLHVFYFWRAFFRGPKYFLGYEERRQRRKLIYKLTRPRRRRHGILWAQNCRASLAVKSFAHYFARAGSIITNAVHTSTWNIRTAPEQWRCQRTPAKRWNRRRSNRSLIRPVWLWRISFICS